jgi:hypothetical protein
MALSLAWSRAAVSAALLGFALMQACGGESDDPPLPPGTAAVSGRSAVGKPVGVGGTGGDGGGSTGATGGMGAIGGNAGETGGIPDELAPIVEVTSPEELSDPNDEGVLVADELDVVCEARQSPAAGAFPVEPSTVTIELLDAEGEVVDTVEADPTDEPDEFSARVLLAGVPDNGRIGFRCNASDGQLPALTGTDTVFSLIDHGPLIEVDSPEEDAAFAQEGGLLFDFTVKSAPLADGDDGAEVDEVLLDVNGVSIELPDPDDGRYRFSVDLKDRELFPETPDGVIPVTLRARNRRDPEPVERLLSYPIVIDGDGPTITIESPKDHEVVGPYVTVHFTVEDELSEIDEASVTVNVGEIEHRFDTAELWKRDGPNFSFSFDSTKFMGMGNVQVTLNVHASDEVGNDSEGRSVGIYFDHAPPIVDLDPGNVRLYREVTSGRECSNSFDPVGPAAPNDRDVVPRLRVFRALIWERTDYLTGQGFLFPAGTDEGSAQIYLERDPTVPLLIDTNSDGVCDELATGGDTPNEFNDLRPLAPAGFAHFGPDDALVSPAVAPDACNFLDEPPPVTLCDDHSDLSIAIPQLNIPSHPPAIYAVAPGSSVTCAGVDWQFGGPNEGWLCFAARAKDNLGNVGISRPLRLCYDNPDDGLPPPECVTDDTPPSCTDGCSLPPSFEPAFLEQ